MPITPNSTLTTLRSLAEEATQLIVTTEPDTDRAIARARVAVSNVFDLLASFDVNSDAERKALLHTLVREIAYELRDARGEALRDARNALGKLQ